MQERTRASMFATAARWGAVGGEHSRRAGSTARQPLRLAEGPSACMPCRSCSTCWSLPTASGRRAPRPRQPKPSLWLRRRWSTGRWRLPSWPSGPRHSSSPPAARPRLGQCRCAGILAGGALHSARSRSGNRRGECPDCCPAHCGNAHVGPCGRHRPVHPQPEADWRCG